MEIIRSVAHVEQDIALLREAAGTLRKHGEHPLALRLEGHADHLSWAVGAAKSEVAEAEERQPDPFPLLEETDDPAELPTVKEWLAAGAPMREVGPAEREEQP